MSEFEFLFTGISIVLALGVARLLEGLRDSFDRARRFWIHYLWVINRIMIALGIFWSLYDDRARTDMGFVVFLSLVMPPAILFLQAHALVTAHPDAVPDWKIHFWTIRRWFFGSNMLLVLGSSLIFASMGHSEALLYASMAVGLLLSIVGFVTTNERAHGILAVISLLMVVSNVTRIATGL